MSALFLSPQFWIALITLAGTAIGIWWKWLNAKKRKEAADLKRKAAQAQESIEHLKEQSQKQAEEAEYIRQQNKTRFSEDAFKKKR